ncbi:FAD-dependent oxidoreductase [Isosphaeraceae bacterium EP7]
MWDFGDLRSVALPKLDDRQMAELGACHLTTSRRYREGERLFEPCSVEHLFFFIKKGEVEIIDETGDVPNSIVIIGPGEFTGEVSDLAGGHPLVCAVARGDCDVYEVSIEALRTILNDHPTLGDIIVQAFIARRQLLRESGSFTGLRVIGSRYSRDTFRVREFLAKNRMPFTWLDLEAAPEVETMLRQLGLSEADTPVVAWGHCKILRNPTDRQLADAAGLRPSIKATTYDLAVVGSGPAGLAAAVYAASEGLSTMVLEQSGPGGQAGRSMRIENYLGFPLGITGAELTDRACMQANKFGASMPVPTQVVGLTFDGPYPLLQLEGGETVAAKCMLIATGAEYRKLGVVGCEPMEGRGVYYAATPNEISMCRGADVMVVGGGNSAGQAAVFLAGQARHVWLLIRGNDLHRNMSSYLVERLLQTPNIELLCNSEVRCLMGEGHLTAVEVASNTTGEVRTIETPALFSFIGAIPRVEWLPPEIERDAKGFVLTGPDLVGSARWTPRRPPFHLETSRPGVFAAGDVRSGSVKRVASAVGEGSMAVQFVHEYLKGM